MAGALLLTMAAVAVGAVTIQEKARESVVTGERYRLSFVRESIDVTFEVRSADGPWRIVSKPGAITYAWSQRGASHEARGVRATWTVSASSEAVVVGQQAVLDQASGTVLDLHYVCRNEGVLLGVRLAQPEGSDPGAILWAPPRLALSSGTWDGYLFWGRDGTAHTGRLDGLQPTPAYAGVSVWEQQGDVARGLSASRPALLARSSQWGVGLGVVFLDYTRRWADAHSFLQRHSAKDLYFYAGYVPASRAKQTLWAWLAPFAIGEADRTAAQVERLVREGDGWVRTFKPTSLPVPQSWLQKPPEFPAQLRRAAPGTDINEAVVFTMGETTASDYKLQQTQLPRGGLIQMDYAQTEQPQGA